MDAPTAVLALQRQIGNRAVARLGQDMPYIGAWASALSPLNQLNFVGRALTQAEKDVVEPIFGVINIPGTTIPRKSLIHECAHVWQSQNGVPAAYAVSALTSQLIAQLFQGDWQKAYDYSGMTHVPWRLWNAEQQADWTEHHERLPSGWWHGLTPPS